MTEEEFKVIMFEEKSSKLDELAKIQADLEALNQIEKDFASLVGTQSEAFINVEKKQEETLVQSQEIGQILKEAAIIQNKTWKMKFVSKLTAIGIGVGLFVGPIGSAIGGAVGGIAGTFVGKKIEKINQTEIEKIRFEKN